MALKKKQSKFGIDFDYWRITKINMDILTNSIQIEIMPYISKKARDNNEKPLEFEKKIISYHNGLSSTESTTFSDFFSLKIQDKNAKKGISLIASIYEYMKENDLDFKNAEDC